MRRVCKRTCGISLSFFSFALAVPFSIILLGGGRRGKGRVGFPDNPISRREARCECECTVARERDWHLTLLNKPKVCSLPGERGYGGKRGK